MKRTDLMIYNNYNLTLTLGLCVCVCVCVCVCSLSLSLSVCVFSVFHCVCVSFCLSVSSVSLCVFFSCQLPDGSRRVVCPDRNLVSAYGRFPNRLSARFSFETVEAEIELERQL